MKCENSKTEAKMTLLSHEGQTIKLKATWDKVALKASKGKYVTANRFYYLEPVFIGADADRAEAKFTVETQQNGSFTLKAVSGKHIPTLGYKPNGFKKNNFCKIHFSDHVLRARTSGLM